MSAAVSITLIVAAATNADAFTRLAQRLAEAGAEVRVSSDDWREIAELPSRDDARALHAALKSLGFSPGICDRVWAGLWAEYARDGGAPLAKTKGVKLLPDVVVDEAREQEQEQREEAVAS